tara:strand:+ start:38 stop:1156 length:1119 start_codon:yes stop_codon:yes gene_type:complete
MKSNKFIKTYTKDENESTKWVKSVICDLPKFLQNMKDNTVPGRYKYSMSGDIKPNPSWGLGNTVFAVKTWYMLNQLNSFEIKEMGRFIKSFARKNGEISDPEIQKRSRKNRYRLALRSGDWNNIFGSQTIRAETRQAFAALRAMGENPDRPYLNIPRSKKKIKKYIHSLDWNHPWGAGSHFSHLIFFLKNNTHLANSFDGNKTDLINYAFDEVTRYRQNDGSWYDKYSNDAQKVNGAMKMVTAYMAAGKTDLSMRDRLIDHCLALQTDPDACNNFNLLLVLYFCSNNDSYRKDEIREFCFNRLQIYRGFYWEDGGGFSFHKKHANSIYYGARISQGFEEPDIHGTHLFLWGIVLITRILELDEELQLLFPIT